MVPAIDRLLGTLTLAVQVLRDNEIPCAVTGDCAVYARGGPIFDGYSEVDLLVRPADAAHGCGALSAAGMRPPLPVIDAERTTLYDHDIRLDLVFAPNYRPVTDELLARAETLPIGAIVAPVVTIADLLVAELAVADPHRVDFTRLLHIARELRAQVDWARVRAETAASPYARAFLGLLDDLGITDGPRDRGSRTSL
ncbi:nucleotidyltransferase family protein [Nocardia heshunensis]